MKIVAIKQFTDKVTKQIYVPGTVISHFSDERVKLAVDSGLALLVVDKVPEDNASTTVESKKIDPENISFQVQDGKVVAKQPEKNDSEKVDANTTEQTATGDVDTTPEEIDMSQQWQKVISLIKSFSDVEKLKGYLAAENAADKPRVSVVAALESRISELSKEGE